MTAAALPSSKLGTQEHWDSVYAREVKNFDELGDKGEVWFGEDAVQRMVDFLEGEAEQGNLPENLNVLDVGTGNGHLLFALLELDSPPAEPQNMLGIDYSAPSVELCKRIATTKGEAAKGLRFEKMDFLAQASELSKQRWDLVCDKGTLDAIALSDKGTSNEDPVARYVSSLTKITRRTDMFLITSCNFTEQELVGLFTDHFEVYHVVPVPSFSFGGQKGSTTVTIAFRRKD